MDWHQRLGLCALGLIVFRLYWGIVGSQTARFTKFVKGPKSIAVYLRTMFSGEPYKPSFGHNPMGALSVLALLGCVCVQVTTGLFAVDVDGLESGPLSRFVEFDTGRLFAEIHERTFDVMLWLIGLHIVAVIGYLVLLKANILIPMITGRRTTQEQAAEMPGMVVPFGKIALGFLLSLSVVYLIASA